MNGELRERWLKELGSTDAVELTVNELDRFPELRDALAPPQFEIRPDSGSCLMRAGGSDIDVELRAELIAPPDLGADQPGLIDLLFTTDAEEDLGRRILINTLDMPPALHTQGLGRLVIGQLAVLGDQLGMEALALQAGKIGRWAWMRCGFDFDPGMRESVVSAAEEFAERLDREVDLSGVEHSWDFRTFRDPVSPEEMRAAGGPVITEAMPLGKALLLGPNENANPWFGHLTLDRKSEERVRLDSYVHGDGSSD